MTEKYIDHMEINLKNIKKDQNRYSLYFAKSYKQTNIMCTISVCLLASMTQSFAQS